MVQENPFNGGGVVEEKDETLARGISVGILVFYGLCILLYGIYLARGGKELEFIGSVLPVLTGFVAICIDRYVKRKKC